MVSCSSIYGELFLRENLFIQKKSHDGGLRFRTDKFLLLPVDLI